MIQSKKTKRSRAQVVVNDIVALARNFTYCSFNYVSRVCNKVVDSIAKASISLEGVKVWMEECPLNAKLPFCQTQLITIEATT